MEDTMSSDERNAAIRRKNSSIQAANTRASEGISAAVMPMNESLSYFLFTYLTLEDVRIVYAPPKNIGFYGGDPDNFEWPRHDGDFTFMRVYAGPDGKPAAYSTKNVPYKPKKFLSISMAGVKDNDFVMVMGYPGSTRRYRESYSIAYNQDTFMPLLVNFFRTQMEALQEEGKANRELQIKLQSRIFDISNTLKDFEGSVTALRREDVVGQKKKQEADFMQWVNANPDRQKKYGDVLPSLANAYDELNKTQPRDTLVQQIAGLSDTFEVAGVLAAVAADKDKPQAERNPNLAAAAMQLRLTIPTILSERTPGLERRLLILLLREAAELPQGQKIDASEKPFGNLTGDGRVRAEEALARTVVDSKNFASAESINKLFTMSTAQLRDLHDPLIDLAGEMTDL